MSLTLKNLITIIIILFFSIKSFSQTKFPFFKAPEEKKLISTDLHIHTVFSDGSVWPDIRVDEAEKESLDLIAITDHLEYQPHSQDIPNPDRNRSFEIARLHRKKGSDLKIINGVEITRSMAPGHINAVFIQNANSILHKDSLSGILEANKQGAFVFWNHPNWISQRNDGIAKLDPYHTFLIKNKLLHGIEVVNENTYSEEAFELALENNLTVLGTSDIHGLIEWSYNISSGGHRPITFVIASSNSDEDIYKGLINNSLAPLKLEYLGNYNLHENSKMLEIDPNSSKTILVKTKEVLEEITLPFRVLNALIGSKENARISYKISI